MVKKTFGIHDTASDVRECHLGTKPIDIVRSMCNGLLPNSISMCYSVKT